MINNFNLISMLSHKNNWKILFVLFLTVTTCSWSWNLNRTLAQENFESLTQPSENEQQIEPTTITRKREQNSILETIWKLLRAKREQEPALSSRSNICEITPGLLGETNLVYSTRPLFLWQGMGSKLEIYLYSPFSVDAHQELLWTKAINGESQNILYTGEPLQPGKIYDWEIVTDSQVNRRRISFQIMDAQERDRISGELEQLETELTTSGATKEEIILAKANYFAEKDLWSDTLQQLSSLETASGNTLANTEEMMSYICQSEPAKFTQ